MTDTKQEDSHYDKRSWENSQVVSTLFRSGYGAILGNLLNISVVTYVLSAVYSEKGLVIWFVVGIALNLVRWFVLKTYIKTPVAFDSDKWLQIYRTLTLFSGIHFGALAIFFLNSSEPLYQVLVIFMVGGSAAAAVGTHGADLTTYRLFVFPSVIPLILRALAEKTEVHNALALMLSLLIFVLLRAARQTRDTLHDNIIMSYSLNYRATHDPLVALLNREEFQKRFEGVQKDLSGNEVQAIIFIDLDNFKTVNDTFGHQAGDEALIEVSNIIRNSIRKSDIAARFGGDEFVIFISASELSDIEAIGQKIIDNIAIYTTTKNVQVAELGASLGIGYSKDAQVEFDKLLKTADQACYKAKRENPREPHVKQA